MAEGRPCQACGLFADLPFTCGKCGDSFCADHQAFVAHECRGHVDKKVPECPVCGQLVPLAAGQDPNAVISDHLEKGCPREARTASPQPLRLNFCAFRDCTTNEHVLVRCRFCSNSYCVPHRLQEDHDCRRLKEELRRRQQKAAAEARKPPPGRRPPGLFGPAFANTAATAVGPADVPSEDRVPLAVYFEESAGVAPLHMFFSRRWPVGKVIDHICGHVKLKNDNNQRPEAEQYHLFPLLPSGAPLPANSPLSSLTGTGLPLQPGNPVLLARGLTLPPALAQALHDHRSAAAAAARPRPAAPGQGARAGDCAVG